MNHRKIAIAPSGMTANPGDGVKIQPFRRMYDEMVIIVDHHFLNKFAKLVLKLFIEEVDASATNSFMVHFAQSDFRVKSVRYV